MPARTHAATSTITAAVLRGPGRLSLERVELEAPRPGEVLVTIAASGVCHTDIGFLDGSSGPVILGHEGAGVVAAVGSEVSDFTPGDHVVMSYASCGLCPPCLAGRPAHCENFWDLNFGFARLDGSNAYGGGVRGHFFGQSSFASHCLTTPRNLVKVDPELSLALLAPLGCGLQTGAGTVVNSLGVAAGQSVLVLGAGTVGLAAVMAARVVGAAPIIAVDLHPKRLELARELGASHVLTNRGADLERRIRAIAPKGINHVLEITGNPDIERLGRALLASGGGMALLTGGDGPGQLPDGRRIFGVIQGDAVPQTFIPWLIALHREGRFPFQRLLREYPFEDIDQAIADSQSGETVKPVLRMDVAGK